MDAPEPHSSISRLRRVLLIEDSADDAVLLRATLATVHPACSVTLCSCLREGLDALKAAPFDLVLFDPGLPDNRGIDGLRRLRAQAPRVPVVVLTGNDDDRLATEALQAGAQDYIVKGQYEGSMLLRAAHHAMDRAEAIELREAERLKSELLAIVSHEMRTPLTVIQENVSLVLEGALGPVAPAQQEFLASAVANCNRLRAMIADLVDTAAIERGALQLQRKPFALVPMLMALAADFRTVLASHGQTLAVDLPDDLTPRVFGDADRLRQAVANLLNNAHKFTPRGGHVTLRARCDGREAHVEVEDDGVGIPRNALDHVFERFFQLGREHGPGLKGAGLGLAIVRHIVERHAGTIVVHSEVGRGSTFRVSLPQLREHGEIQAFLKPLVVSRPDDRGPTTVSFVRLRTTTGPDATERLREFTDGLRAALRAPLDDVTLLEGEQVVVVVGADDERVRARIQDAPDADALEWATCPIAAAAGLETTAGLRFVPVTP
jgi:signal transduction histidine kinase